MIEMKENKLVDLSMNFTVKIMKTCENINRDVANNLYNESGTIRRLLIASINYTKENM
jgi:hypothetical protein